MNTETQKVDVLEVIKDAIKRTSPTTHFNERANLWAMHDAVAELIEATARTIRYADSEPDGGEQVEVSRANIEQLRAALARVGGAA